MNTKDALRVVQESEGYIGPETLTMYKQASASIPLGDSYPPIANNIVNVFYKTASEVPAGHVAYGLAKLAGVDPATKMDTIQKLAAVASMHNEEGVNQAENNVACYHLICDLTR